MKEDARPDPELILRRLEAEEARGARAKLKIFFGFAPGVGKTYAMLEAAGHLVEKGTEVLVGAVETHGRNDTAALLTGLEVLPRKVSVYRGKELTEFDLDAALARRPKVLLLDELAHTNAPGSRHAKRWQDALELLDAGIEVHTSLNVQHVESLNDVVAQITHVQVRETVPDAVLDRADEIELVDISPEELLKRLGAGKVYLGEQAARATQHFFQRGNLLALRELALRRTAERVDRDVLAYREEHGVEAMWPAGERILVMVGPAPASGTLVRAAKRMAAGLRAPWIATYVDAVHTPRSDADRARLDAHLRLAESLGGTVVRLSGRNVPDTVLDYARKNNVTRILLGKPTHSRLLDRLRGSLLDDVVRGSGAIEVHAISGVDAPESAAHSARAAGARADLGGYGYAALAIAGTTGLAWVIDRAFDVPDVEMLFLLAVILTARFGRGPSLLAAFLAVGAFNFFFVPPHFTFAISDTKYVLTFAMMFGVSLILSTLTLRLRNQEAEALAREERTRALLLLSRDLASARGADEIAAVAARHVTEVFRVGSVVLLPDDAGVPQPVAARPSDAVVGADAAVVRWSFEHARPAGRTTDTLPGAAVLCVPLKTNAGAAGVLALVEPPQLDGEQRSLLEAFSTQVAVAVERADLAEKARRSAIAAKAEQLRSSLLASVSHDLRTPLASITGAATTLRDESEVPPAVRADLVQSICEEAERLERLVSNLLDMTRLESGEVRPRLDWLPADEAIGGALVRLEKRLGGRAIKTSVEADVPLLHVDPLLMEQLMFNLLENASKYTPEGSPIEVSARLAGTEIEIEIADRGRGFPAGDEEKLFERFYRGAHDAFGVGLGLSICRAIATIHGGTLIARNRPGGGASFVLRLPREEPPRSVRGQQDRIEAT